jgi:hypothetical protein
MTEDSARAHQDFLIAAKREIEEMGRDEAVQSLSLSLSLSRR